MDALLEQTEGWPAGLYLAALAANGRRPSSKAFAFRGDDVLMGDFLRTEVLDHLPAHTVRFLTRTSVLDQMSGPSCDAVVGADGSQAVLESLEAAGLLLVPLDRQRTWYRYHRLFRDLLATELQQREPDLVPELHGRAARWLAANGMPEQAIRQAQRADDPDLLVSLVAAMTPPAYAAGRAKDAHGWLEWFHDRNLIEAYPQVAVVGALVEALVRPRRERRAVGRRSRVRRRRRRPRRDVQRDARVPPQRAVPARRHRDGVPTPAQAAALLGPHHGLHAAALLFEGLAYLLAGDPDGAEPRLAHAHDVAMYARSLPAATAATAFRGFIAVGRKEWDVAEAFAECGARDRRHRAPPRLPRGHHRPRPRRPDGQPPRRRAGRRRPPRTGRAGPAAVHLRRARRPRSCSSSWRAPTCRSAMRPGPARCCARCATCSTSVRTSASSPPQAEALRRSLDAIRQGPVGASALTAAELRLLPFLATHLSFPEIGERLHVSRHTVKTQAISVYRKFGVSSRSEAIRCAHDVGLLGM